MCERRRGRGRGREEGDGERVEGEGRGKEDGRDGDRVSIFDNETTRKRFG